MRRAEEEEMEMAEEAEEAGTAHLQAERQGSVLFKSVFKHPTEHLTG